MVLVILAPCVFLLKLKTSVVLPKTSYQDQCPLILLFSFTILCYFCNTIVLISEMKNHCHTHTSFMVTLNITGPYMRKYNSISCNIILQFKTSSTEVCLSKAYSNHFKFSQDTCLDQFWYKPPISMLIFQMSTFQPPKFCAHFSFPPLKTDIHIFML